MSSLLSSSIPFGRPGTSLTFKSFDMNQGTCAENKTIHYHMRYSSGSLFVSSLWHLLSQNQEMTSGIFQLKGQLWLKSINTVRRMTPLIQTLRAFLCLDLFKPCRPAPAAVFFTSPKCHPLHHWHPSITSSLFVLYLEGHNSSVECHYFDLQH